MSSNFSLSIFSYFFWRITTQRSDEKYTIQCEAVDKYLYELCWSPRNLPKEMN